MTTNNCDPRMIPSQSFSGASNGQNNNNNNNNSNNNRPFGSNLENLSSLRHADSTASLPVAVDIACEELKERESNNSKISLKVPVDPIANLQMTLLFMPPPERRRLQMFLRLLSRLLENQLICQRLAPNGDLRSVLVSMFAPIFIRPKSGDESNTLYTRGGIERLSALLLDKHSAIFAVPEWLQGDVNSRLEKLRRLRSEVAANSVSSPVASYQNSPVGTPSPRSVPQYCQRITMQQFKKQALINPRQDDIDSSSPTHDSLYELLASIATNKELGKKEKAKRLKEFEKIYPDIYKEYFANLENQTENDTSVNKENGSSSNNASPLSATEGKVPRIPRIKEPMLLRKIRQRFGSEQN